METGATAGAGHGICTVFVIVAAGVNVVGVGKVGATVVGQAVDGKQPPPAELTAVPEMGGGMVGVGRVIATAA